MPRLPAWSSRPRSLSAVCASTATRARSPARLPCRTGLAGLSGRRRSRDDHHALDMQRLVQGRHFFGRRQFGVRRACEDGYWRIAVDVGCVRAGALGYRNSPASGLRRAAKTDRWAWFCHSGCEVGKQDTASACQQWSSPVLSALVILRLVAKYRYPVNHAPRGSSSLFSASVRRQRCGFQSDPASDSAKRFAIERPHCAFESMEQTR